MRNNQAQDGMALVRWAPRVSRDKIWRLYASEARGLIDEVLLDDVLIGVYLRCRSVTTASEAHNGRVECPRCGNVLLRGSGGPDEVIRCGACGWEVTWGAYHKSFQHKNLFWGGAFPAVKAFMEGFDDARTPRDKMLLLDRFIHACHWEMTHHPGRPAASLVIEGKENEVVELIETLAYADNCPPQLRASREAWNAARQGLSRPLPPDPRPWNALGSELFEQFSREGQEMAERLRQKDNCGEQPGDGKAD